jgi:hypothetical protein
VDGFIYSARAPRFAEPRFQLASATVAPPPAARLGYARIDSLMVGKALPRPLRLGSDVTRLAMLEDRPVR